jgi:high-affinity K+ transport system ATPase subunit B
MDTNLQLRIGTGSGTLLSIIGALGMDDLLKTVVLAAVGATVSFAMTLLLQRLHRRRKK